MDILEHAEDFLLTGRQGGWSQGTVGSYGWHIRQMTTWLAKRDILTFEDLTPRVLRTYGARNRDRWAPATCKSSVIAIRSMLKWAVAEDLCDASLLKVLRVPKVPNRIHRTVTAEEVGLLLAACVRPYSGLTEQQSYSANLRNRAIVALLFDSMIRAAELCNLRVEDLDLEKRVVTVRNGKGGKDRIAHYSETTASLLDQWLKLRPFVACEDCDHVFVGITGNTPGQTLTVSGLRLMLRRLSRRAGVKFLGPHAFRRGGAVQAIRNGASSRAVQDMGGWEHITMIETYTRALDGNELYDKFPPMGAVAVHLVESPDTLPTMDEPQPS